MDQREHQLQYSNICIRLFNFLKSLASQALKITLTLGPPPLMNRGFSQVPIPSAAQDGAYSKNDHQMAAASPGEAALSGAKIELEQDNASKTLEPFGDPHGRELQPAQDNDSQMNSVKRQLEEEETLSAAAPQPKAPKKTVSFNDVVEEMSMSKPKQNKKIKKATKNSTSLEREEDPKPLRSILKVGSKVNEKSDLFVNPSGDG